MLATIKKSPKFSIKNHPNYRVVKVSSRQGNVVFVLPHANLVVPDREKIRDLSDLIQLYEKVSSPRHPFSPQIH
jgi:hypothetical protein